MVWCGNVESCHATPGDAKVGKLVPPLESEQTDKSTPTPWKVKDFQERQRRA